MKKALAVAMVAYIGTKSILATPMSRGEYCEYRGWNIPEGEDPNEPVYLVEYTDGGKPNDERHAGYITMSPQEVFDNAYRQNGSLNFGDALMALKQGKKVARSCWNDLQYVVAQGESKQIESTYIWNPHNKAHAEKLGGFIDVAPYCTLKTAQDTLAMGWTPSTGDLFAEDWTILE
ncbi:DUF2829 domain-containing protein [Acinetobacter sp. ME22]|uniref:DUF2829 domain-containing protein n=1 Tax=Acinetobacter sp. ME22 TaxID=2904802 RepID=UPI001EDB007F|nr:DUF2829 domain-containing protein [Acinetobacter sp. ME22]MCG2572255.1 DUF2829 domain-containing protein [Acinetobacter sp. ME22]